MKIVTAAELELADVVEMEGQHLPFMTFIVKAKDAAGATLFRPYGAHADFSYTGGVICYVGIEEMHVRADSALKFVLYQRSPLK